MRTTVLAIITLILGSLVTFNIVLAQNSDSSGEAHEIANQYLDANWRVNGGGAPEYAPSEVLAVRYFDANWALFLDNGSTVAKTGDANRSAAEYFDANWTLVSDARQNTLPADQDLAVANKYFDENWAAIIHGR